MIFPLALGKQTRTNLFDGLAEHGVAPHQQSAGARVVVGSKSAGHRPHFI
jgi:hypothetical protein